MKILLYGGPKRINRFCAEHLLSQGHDVDVLVETDEEKDFFREIGVGIFTGSVFQLQSLEKGMAKKDIVIFLGTSMPEKNLPKLSELRPFDRIRRDGTRSFMSAALRQRVPLVMVVSSVVVYGDCGENWVDETTALNPLDVGRSFVDMEEILSQGSEFQGLNRVILRAGVVYSAHTLYMQHLFSAVKQGKTPPLAGERNFISLVHVEDFAEAIACAVKKAPTGAVINIVDDAPVRINEFLSKTALAMGVRPPGAIPGFMLRLYLGRDVYKLLKSSCRVNNSKAKELLGWKPRFPSVLERVEKEINIWNKYYFPDGSE